MKRFIKSNIKYIKWLFNIFIHFIIEMLFIYGVCFAVTREYPIDPICFVTTLSMWNLVKILDIEKDK